MKGDYRVKLFTSRFGEIDIEEDKLINFTQGLLGFPDVKRYIVLDHPNNPDIDEHDLKGLNITEAEDCGIISIVTIPHGEPEKMTANLQGPVLVNLRTREGKQIVLESDKYPLRYSLIKDIPVSKP